MAQMNLKRRGLLLPIIILRLYPHVHQAALTVVHSAERLRRPNRMQLGCAGQQLVCGANQGCRPNKPKQQHYQQR